MPGSTPWCGPEPGVYRSLACSAATEALESTGDVVVEESLESREQVPPSA